MGEFKRDEKGLFQKGCAPGPGRPVGRKSSLHQINTILIKRFEKNKEMFLKELDQYILDEGMLKYFDKYIAPRLPQTLDINASLSDDTPEEKKAMLAYLKGLQQGNNNQGKLDVTDL